MLRNLALIMLLLVATPTAASDYDPARAGHPLRIAAYVLHPVGVLLDRLIFRPAWHIGCREPARTLFGVRLPPEDQIEETPEELAGPTR